MKEIRKAGRVALLLFAVILVATGCMPRGGVTNPGWTVVTAKDHVVYAAMATGQVVALDATQSGSELWTYPGPRASGGGIGGLFKAVPQGEVEAPLDAVYGIPALTDEYLLVASYDGGLYALNRETGKMAWTFDVDKAIIGGITLRDGVAYFSSSDHNVYALDLATQSLVWSEPFATGNWVWGAPAVDDSRVYVGGMDHFAYAIDRKTGKLDWKVDVGASIPGRVTLNNGTLFVGAIDRRLHAYDTASGTELWQTDVLGGWVWGEALVADGYVYFGSLDGTLHSASVADGTPRWPAKELDGALRAGPALMGGALIVGTEAGLVYRIDVATGQHREFNGAAGAILSTPAVDDDIVYIGTTNGKIQALNFARDVDPFVWTYPRAK